MKSSSRHALRRLNLIVTSLGLASVACFESKEVSETEATPRHDPSSTIEPSEPSEPLDPSGTSGTGVQCHDLVDRRLSNAEEAFRPGLSTRTLLDSLGNPLTMRFQADPMNPFALLPSIDGKTAIYRFHYTGGKIDLSFWSQDPAHPLSNPSDDSVECWDELRVPTELEIRTEDGAINDRLPGVLTLRIPAGRPFDRRQLRAEFLPPNRVLQTLRNRFKASEPKLMPGQSLVGWRLDLLWSLEGHVVQGALIAVWFVDILGQGDQGPGRIDLMARFTLHAPPPPGVLPANTH